MPDGDLKSNEQLWTIDELIRSRARTLKDRPLLCYPRNGIVDYEEHSASAIDGFVDAAVQVLQARGFKEVVSANEEPPPNTRTARHHSNDQNYHPAQKSHLKMSNRTDIFLGLYTG